MRISNCSLAALTVVPTLLVSSLPATGVLSCLGTSELYAVQPAQRTQQAREALEQVGLSQRAHHRGLELSGGEQQRVALARALAHRPRFIVADEPTGNLDSLTGRAITDLLRDICHQSRLGLLVATHDQVVVAAADHIVQIQDGRIIA
jgi:ABC-type lipoprotein export system ATPase subunit